MNFFAPIDDDILPSQNRTRAAMLDIHQDHDWCLIYDIAIPFDILAPALKWTARANMWDRKLGYATPDHISPELRLFVDAKTGITMGRISREDCITLRDQFRLAGQRIAAAGILLSANDVLKTQVEQAQARTDYRAFISAKLTYC
ncbi:MAG TPA: hypothetical protein VIN59_00070 [Alphaproteobacteria bacterium]